MITTFNKKNITLYFFASIILLYFIFTPALNLLYYAGDDFRYASGGYNKACMTDDGFHFMITVGRPLQAYLDCLSYKFAFTLERMNVVRLFAVITLAACMSLFADILCALGLSFFTAFFAAGCLFLLPHLYENVLIGATSLSLSLFFILLAQLCMIKVQAYHSLVGTRVSATNRTKPILWEGLTYTFLLCSLLTYPALSFFFVSITLAKLLFSNLSDWLNTRRQLIREVMIFIIACIIYFIWAYHNMHHYSAKAPVPQQYHLDHPNFNLLEIFNRFIMLANVFNHLLIDLFQFGNPILENWTTIGLIVAATVITFYYFSKSKFYLNNKKTALTYLMQACVGAVILVVLSSAFFLVIPHFDMGGRLRFGSAASLFVLLFWCIYQCSMMLPQRLQSNVALLLLVIAFMSSAKTASLTTMRFALTAEENINVIKHSINQYLGNHDTLKRIHFVISKEEYPYNKFFLANGALVQILGHDRYDLKWCSRPRGEPGNEKDYQNQVISCISKLPAHTIAITYSHYDDSFLRSGDMLLIDS